LIHPSEQGCQEWNVHPPCSTNSNIVCRKGNIFHTSTIPFNCVESKVLSTKKMYQNDPLFTQEIYSLIVYVPKIW
jgi:hypothetical protein